MSPEPAYDLNQLALLADVTPRAVQFYIQQGLLAAPPAEGSSIRFGRAHLDRVCLVSELQRDGQELDDIRTYLEGLHAAEVRDLLEVTAIARAASISMEHVRARM